MIELAKPAIDVGLYTNNRDAMLEFWQQRVGLAFTETLPVGSGLHQLRHALGDSVLKINHSRTPLEQAPAGGITALSIAQPNAPAPCELNDPDGNRVILVPPGHKGVSQLCVHLAVSDLAAHQHFYGNILGLPEIQADRFACGASQIALTASAAANLDPAQRAPGYRYLTIQVFDVRATHAQILADGGREGLAPVRLGDVAHISFVRDPDGNWIEISQRKSITGSLD